jgi:hypothetical protein
MIPSAYFPGVWTINTGENPFIPPVETFYILLQDGGKITTQVGEDFTLQEAP